MIIEDSFISCIEKSIKDNWDLDALTDYKGITLQYHDVARKIEKLHILFENSGVVKGDRIALCGRNCANWAVAFLATLTYGAVAVPILHEFTPDYNLFVNEGGAALLVRTIDPILLMEIRRPAMITAFWEHQLRKAESLGYDGIHREKIRMTLRSLIQELDG